MCQNKTRCWSLDRAEIRSQSSGCQLALGTGSLIDATGIRSRNDPIRKWLSRSRATVTVKGSFDEILTWILDITPQTKAFRTRNQVQLFLLMLYPTTGRNGP